MLLQLFLGFLFILSVCTIDPDERVGTCAQLNLNVSYYINENEGVWFPQYRAKDEDRKENIYTCHTTYEKAFFDEDNKPWLESTSYYNKDDEIVEDGRVQVFYKTEERGKLNYTTTIPGIGEYQIYNYILNLTPEYRVRYVCTDYPQTSVQAIYIETRKLFPKMITIEEAVDVINKNKLTGTLVKIRQSNCKRQIVNGFGRVQAIYIETRKLYPKLKTIQEAVDVIKKHNLSGTFVKIKQSNCKRPINMGGYVPLVSKTESN